MPREENLRKHMLPCAYKGSGNGLSSGNSQHVPVAPKCPCVPSQVGSWCFSTGPCTLPPGKASGFGGLFGGVGGFVVWGFLLLLGFLRQSFVLLVVSNEESLSGAQTQWAELLWIASPLLETECLWESDQCFPWQINECEVAAQLCPPGCIMLAMTCMVPLLTTLYHFCTRFADQFGTRAALILSCASGSAFFLLMSISTSIPILFLSRLPAVFMHGLPGKVGRGWMTFQIAFTAYSSLLAHIAGSQQAQQHEGRQEAHLMVRGEMVRMWSSRCTGYGKQGW